MSDVIEAASEADAPGSCTRDEECDDKNPCNGMEWCSESRCVPGSDPCPNPDPQHCNRACTPLGNAANCGTIRAADKDHDGHGAIGCTDDPTGDDCDDGNPAVHPGANEICDGIDNDCNGQTDLSDGLVLSGSIRQWDDAGRSISTAWIPQRNVYAVTWLRDGNINYNGMGAKGQRAYLDRVAIPVPDGGSAFTNSLPELGSGGDVLGMMWSGAADVFLQRFDFDGTAIGTPVSVGNTFQPDFTVRRFSGGNWAVFGTCCGKAPSLFGKVVSDGWVPSVQTQSLGSAVSYHVAVSSDNLGIIRWQMGMPNGTDTLSIISWMRRSSSLDPLGDEVTLVRATAPADAGWPVIAARSGRYAVAWKETTVDGSKYVRFAEFGEDGSTICGPVDLRKSFKSDSPEFTPVDMAAGDIGYALLSASAASPQFPTSYEIAVVRPGCAFMERFAVGAAFDGSQDNVSISSGGSAGFAVTYQAGNYPMNQVYAGAFGPHFCD
jgi:hypothetical protein